MSAYNHKASVAHFYKRAGWLARDVDYDPDNKPTEQRVDAWRSAIVDIVETNKSANRHIDTLEARIEQLEAQFGVVKGWRFCTADFSLQASGVKTTGRVTLIRSPEQRALWNSLPDEVLESDDSPPLYAMGVEDTLEGAIANACVVAIHSKPIPTTPTEEKDDG